MGKGNETARRDLELALAGVIAAFPSRGQELLAEAPPSLWRYPRFATIAERITAITEDGKQVDLPILVLDLEAEFPSANGCAWKDDAWEGYDAFIEQDLRDPLRLARQLWRSSVEDERESVLANLAQNPKNAGLRSRLEAVEEDRKRGRKSTGPERPHLLTQEEFENDVLPVDL